MLKHLCILHIYIIYLYQLRIKTIENMIVIINRNANFGTLDGVITEDSKLRKLVNQHLKQGTAKKLVDNDETLMYELGEKS